MQALADHVTKITGIKHIAIDDGPNVSPCYDIIKPPMVGDKVSYAFDGDYYPDGVIVRVTAKYTVTTSTGNTYRRKKLTDGWFRPGGTWCLVSGHINERNLSF